MKKLFVLFLAFFAGILALKSYADTAKAVPVSAQKTVLVVISTPVNPAADNGLLADESGVPNDKLITWESEIVAKGLKSGDAGYEDARQLCITYNKAFDEAHQLKADHQYLQAAKKVPLSWVKSWYLYNYAASLVADRDDAGKWNYDAEDVAKNSTEAIKYFNMAKVYSDKAVKAGIVGTGANSPENLEAMAGSGLKAIDEIQNPKPVKTKHKKAKAPAADADDANSN
jgi:hypothetical protein